MFLNIGVLRVELPGEIPCQNPRKITMTKFIFNKVAGSQSATLQQFRLQLSEYLFSSTRFIGFVIHFVSTQ